MALYTSAQYRAGHQGYVAWKAQTAQLVYPHTITDPSLQSGLTNVFGPCSLPSEDITENVTEVRGVGSSMALGHVPGRREINLALRGNVADATLLAHAFRNRTTPSASGRNKGLTRLCLETGTDNVFGDGIGAQHLDAVINSLSFRSAEGQPITFDMNIMSMVALPQPSPQTDVTAPDGDVLIWAHQSFGVGGTDYHPILAGVDFSIDNGVQRQGCRQQFGALGTTELAISRTPESLTPTAETLRFSVRLHDDLPTAMRDTDSWGAVTLRWEQAGTGAGRRYLQLVIDYNYVNRRGRQQADANGLLSWSCDIASRAVAMTTGTT